MFGSAEEECNVWGPISSTVAAVYATGTDHVPEGSEESGICFWAKPSSIFVCSCDDGAAAGKYMEDSEIRGMTWPPYVLDEHADDGRVEEILL